MNIMAVDDELLALSLLSRAIQAAAPGGETPACFSNVKDAYMYAEQQPVDIAFLDIEIRDVSGVELAKVLKKIKPDMNIIFVTGHAEYMGDAFGLFASGFIIKPPSAELIKEQLNNLRHNITGVNASKPPESIGAFTLDHAAGRVLRDGKTLFLTPMEYKILLCLVSASGEFMTPRELYAKATGLDAGNDIRALYVRMTGLRKKLGLDDTETKPGIDIERKYRKGYRLIVL